MFMIQASLESLQLPDYVTFNFNDTNSKFIFECNAQSFEC